MRSLFFWHCVQHASVIDWQQSSCPAWLLSPLVRGPSAVALLGTWCQFAAWTVFLLSRWWRPGGQGLFFPLCPVQCLLHREPVRSNANWVVPSQRQPTLHCPIAIFFYALWIDHITQGIVASSQICIALDTSLSVIHSSDMKSDTSSVSRVNKA